MVGVGQSWRGVQEAEDVEEAKEVEDQGSREGHRKRKALRAVVFISELESFDPYQAWRLAAILLELAHEERFLLAALVRNDNERQQTKLSLPRRF